MKKKIIIIGILVVIILTSILIYCSNKYKNGNETAAINLYKNIIDRYSINNIDLLKNCDYIFIDTTSIIDPLNNTQLSNELKKEFIDYCKKYNNNIYSKKDENNALNGIKIKFNISSKNKNEIIINVNYNLLNSNNIGGNEYICVYNNGVWTINESGNLWMS